MIPYHIPRQLTYDPYLVSNPRYGPLVNNLPNYVPNNDGGINHADNSGTQRNNTGSHVGGGGVYGMNYSPAVHYRTKNTGRSTGRHQKSKTLSKTEFPLINKFQSNPQKTSRSSTSTRSEMILSYNINFPVHQQIGDIPLEKVHSVKSIYPRIETKKYSTSAIDPSRNYVTVYEYSINNQWIIWDYETGFVHLTGIWKASINDEINTHKNLKADIVKLLESTPRQYHQYIKRIRGGFLKIQGTWLPYDLCKILAKRFCYHIRYELIPIFGNSFPDECLSPSHKGFGELKLDETNDNARGIWDSKTDSKSHKVVKQRFSSLIDSPVIIKSSSLPHLVTPINQLPWVNIVPTHSIQQLPQTAGSLAPLYLSTPQQTPQQPAYQPNAFYPTPYDDFNALHKSAFQFPPQQHNPPATLKQPSRGDSPHHAPQSPRHTPPSPHDHRTPKDPALQLSLPDVSFRDMVDVVNASKCLQSLSQTQVSPINYELVSNRDYITSIRKTPSSHSSPNNGISSILLAAGVGEQNPTSPTHTRRVSMKINDILS